MKIKQQILEIIERGRAEGNLYFLPDQQLDRKTYLEVNKVLSALGGKWNRKAHIFSIDISDAIDNVLLTGEVIDRKKEFQFFETPLKVAMTLITLAEIELGHECLEPSAGHGNIAEPMRDVAGSGNVTCIELMPENVDILEKKGFLVTMADFLLYTPDIDFDRIAMNPPFTRQLDITHVEKALDHLAPGGVLVSVMSAGVMFRKNKRTLEFWDKIREYPFWDTYDLPSVSFKVSGTSVNTVILKVKKGESDQ